MATATFNTTATFAGVSAAATIQRSASSFIVHDLSGDDALPAAKAGEVSSTPGTLTMVAGHGLIENDVVDVYWEDGIRYGCVVGAVATNAVPVTGGAGDALPAEATDVTVQKQIAVDTDFIGTLLRAICATCTQKAHICFKSGGSVALPVEIGENEMWNWIEGNGMANPLSGVTVTSAVVSQGGTAEAIMKVMALYDGT